MTSDAPPLAYLDNAATTPCRPEVAAEVARVLVEVYGNPSSRHRVGLAAERILRGARQVMARKLGCAPEGITFCSGGTEANALAVLGVTRAGGGGGHALLSAVEHPSVLGNRGILEREGVAIDLLPVTGGGWVDPERAAALARPDTRLLALMLVNNETGITQPVAEVARAVRERAPRCKVLVDCVQAFTAMPVDLAALGADLVSVSGHKVQGPKGSGCLAMGRGVKLAPVWGGGDQEDGRRPGTENLAGVAGLALAVELARPHDPALSARMGRLERAALDGIPGAYLVGDQDRRAPHIMSVATPALPSEVLMNMLEQRGVCVSSGSACHSRRSLRSHVMAAMGLARDHGVVRISLSSATTDEEVDLAVEALRDLNISK